MNKKNVLILILAFSIVVNADVAPNPDGIRMTNNLIIETAEDLSDYRFFLIYAGDAVHEVEIKSKSRTEIQSHGGGARYSSGTLYAIPKKELKKFSEKPTNQEISLLLHSVEEEFTEGVKLGEHQFSAIIKRSEAGKWSSPIYRIERDDEKGVKLIRLETAKGEGGEIDININGIVNNLNPLLYLVIIAFPTAAIIILGIWLFRRKGRKLG